MGPVDWPSLNRPNVALGAGIGSVTPFAISSRPFFSVAQCSGQSSLEGHGRRFRE